MVRKTMLSLVDMYIYIYIYIYMKLTYAEAYIYIYIYIGCYFVLVQCDMQILPGFVLMCILLTFPEVRLCFVDLVTDPPLLRA